MAVNKTKIKIDYQKLIDRDFLMLAKKIIISIIQTDDAKKANEISGLLDAAVKQNITELRNNSDIFKFYQAAIIKLKFIALPIIDNNDALDLIKNHFVRHYNLEFFNIADQIKNKLSGIEVYEERDKFKGELRKALLNNQEKITPKAGLKTVSDWLKDYNVKLGIGLIDKLKKAQYLTDLDKIKELKDTDKSKLKVLFDFYDQLKFSTLDPQGFEEDVPIMINGKLSVFSKGSVETIKDDVANTKLLADVLKGGGELEQLKQLAAGYPPGSLERKAVEEEIEKLELGIRN